MFLMSNDTMHNQAITILKSHFTFSISVIFLDLFQSILKESFETAKLHLNIFMQLQKVFILIVPPVIVGEAWKIYRIIYYVDVSLNHKDTDNMIMTKHKCLVLCTTPARTLSISGLKFRVLKLPFLT